MKFVQIRVVGKLEYQIRIELQTFAFEPVASQKYINHKSIQLIFWTMHHDLFDKIEFIKSRIFM
jgi:hypothetical protein